ncbi:Serine/Threonine kinase domain protein (macronuclear) [Tetrahymena thermophila SB210]|uniref:Serine/Threonine kinase domain protein n=1 Tax=Tetrahymena thermophila (strain SB210) TaxID=312017 RepID=I7M962_TETTS|nr:Serine/Threonine kinase domain protein [Tetrahymena thermophila SB210]EAS00862.2 Serine/Threonine kinase domain protein [Tetrahymena thermophila SB210]|eukprot:XP_001021107.2 Serine/Threonine kinase domain protein [Tetrahymena thermophila SB210]
MSNKQNIDKHDDQRVPSQQDSQQHQKNQDQKTPAQITSNNQNGKMSQQSSKDQQQMNSRSTINKKKYIGHYIIGETLGEGTFGKVKVATHILTGEKVAIKILEKEKIQDVSDVERVSREIHILKLLRHQNIIQLYEIIETEKQLFLITEYASGGELFDYIVKNTKVQEREASVFFQQIISGVEYIHKLKIVHRDMKPENLLLSYNKRIKIVDFGLSNTYKKNELLKTACGSPCYAAPEMIAGKRYLGLGVDIWSCGVILFALVCGYLPFEDPNTSNLYKKILAGDYQIPKFVSSEGRDLIKNILTTDPTKRFTISDIRKHPWFNQVKPNPMCEGIIVGYNRIPIDFDIIQQLEKFNIDKEFAKNCVEANKHNHITTSYYLLLRKHIRNGGKSIADISSENFDNTLLQPNKPPQQNKHETILEDERQRQSRKNQRTKETRISVSATKELDNQSQQSSNQQTTITQNYEIQNTSMNMNDLKGTQNSLILSQKNNLQRPVTNQGINNSQLPNILNSNIIPQNVQNRKIGSRNAQNQGKIYEYPKPNSNNYFYDSQSPSPIKPLYIAGNQNGNDSNKSEGYQNAVNTINNGIFNSAIPNSFKYPTHPSSMTASPRQAAQGRFESRMRQAANPNEIQEPSRHSSVGNNTIVNQIAGASTGSKQRQSKKQEAVQPLTSAAQNNSLQTQQTPTSQFSQNQQYQQNFVNWANRTRIHMRHISQAGKRPGSIQQAYEKERGKSTEPQIDDSANTSGYKILNASILDQSLNGSLNNTFVLNQTAFINGHNINNGGVGNKVQKANFNILQGITGFRTTANSGAQNNYLNASLNTSIDNRNNQIGFIQQNGNFKQNNLNSTAYHNFNLGNKNKLNNILGVQNSNRVGTAVNYDYNATPSIANTNNNIYKKNYPQTTFNSNNVSLNSSQIQSNNDSLNTSINFNNTMYGSVNPKKRQIF